MASFRSIEVDGRTQLVPNDPPAAPRNPPLAALNATYRSEDAERHDDIADVVKATGAAVKSVLGRRQDARRVQKSLRPVGV